MWRLVKVDTVIPVLTHVITDNLARLLQYSCSDPLISYWNVSTINSYVPIFKKTDSLTIPMLEKLFALLGKQFDSVYPGVTEKSMVAMVSLISL